MSRNRTPADKVADWLAVYEAVKDELTPAPLREMVKLADANGSPAGIALGVQMAQIVFRNDRTAAIAAAMLTQSGVTRPIVGEDGDPG